MTPTAFSTLPLSPALLANLDTLGYHEMTTIQAERVPPVLHARVMFADRRFGPRPASVSIGCPRVDSYRPRPVLMNVPLFNS